MAKQPRSQSGPLRSTRDVGVAHEHDVLLVLEANHAEQPTMFLRDPECDTRCNFGFQLGARHESLGPSVRREDAAIGLGGLVDDRQRASQVLFLDCPECGHACSCDFVRANCRHIPTNRWGSLTLPNALCTYVLRSRARSTRDS